MLWALYTNLILSMVVLGSTLMITLDPYLKEVFPKPPLLAFKRQRNIGDIIIKSQIPKQKPQRQKRKSNGMKKCHRCPLCPFIKEEKVITQNNTRWKLNTQINCQSENVVYMIICKKENCNLKYIGESERSIKERVSEHISYIRTKNRTQATGEHFNLPGHSLHDMEAIGL